MKAPRWSGRRRPAERPQPAQRGPEGVASDGSVAVPECGARTGETLPPLPCSWQEPPRSRQMTPAGRERHRAQRRVDACEPVLARNGREMVIAPRHSIPFERRRAVFGRIARATTVALEPRRPARRVPIHQTGDRQQAGDGTRKGCVGHRSRRPAERLRGLRRPGNQEPVRGSHKDRTHECRAAGTFQPVELPLRILARLADDDVRHWDRCVPREGGLAAVSVRRARSRNPLQPLGFRGKLLKPLVASINTSSARDSSRSDCVVMSSAGIGTSADDEDRLPTACLARTFVCPDGQIRFGSSSSSPLVASSD